MSKKKFAADALLAADISVIFVSGIFMFILLSCEALPLAFLYLAMSAALVGFCFASKDPFEWVTKVLMCIPFSALAFVFFWKTHFAVRAVNWVFPGHGSESGASRSASGLLLLMYGAACLVCALVALSSSSPENEKERKYIGKTQIKIGSVTAGIVAVLVVLLALVFPPMSQVIVKG